MNKHKHSRRRLTLNTDTVRYLQSDEMARALGGIICSSGAPTQVCPTGEPIRCHTVAACPTGVGCTGGCPVFSAGC